MRHHIRAFACGSVIALLFAGCGGKQSMASKSAAAFAEARAKGVPVAAGEHGGHSATTTAPPSGMEGMAHAKMHEHGAEQMSGMDHAAMPPMNHAAMPGMNHAAMPAAHAGMGSMDHSMMTGMNHGAMSGHAGKAMPEMDHASMPGMQHGDMPEVQHGGMIGMQHVAANTAVVVNTAAPRSSGEMSHIQPGATLRGDEFDAPAPAAVAEAAKTTATQQPMKHHEDER